jgi:hypothetical protein
VLAFKNPLDTDVDRPGWEIGQEEHDTKLLYAGPKYGMKTREEYNKLLESGALGRGQQAVELTGQQILDHGKNIYNKVGEVIPDFDLPEMSPEVKNAVNTAGQLAGKVWEFSGLQRQVNQTMNILDAPVKAIAWTSKQVDPTKRGIGEAPLRVAETALPFVGGAKNLAKKGIQKGLQYSDEIADAIKISQQLQPAYAGAASKVDDVAKPLMLQKDLVPSQTLKNIPIGSSAKDVSSQLPSKYYNQLKPKYRYITKGKLSKDEALLGTLRGREETIDTLWTKLQKLEAEKVELKGLSEKLSLTELKKLDYNLYRKIKLNKKYIKETAKDIQDTAAYNIFGTEKRIYMTDSVRTKLKKELTDFSGGDEWHHIFNSKDAGEYMLTEVAQDPLIAANLFQHMKKLKLDSSGISSNLALMRKVPHGKWHKLMKDTGVEPAGFIKDLKRWKRAELSLAEYGNDIAAAVKAGTTDVNELFTLLEKYKLFQDELSKELFTKYGAKKFSDIPGVKEIIESHSFKTATGK